MMTSSTKYGTKTTLNNTSVRQLSMMLLDIFCTLFIHYDFHYDLMLRTGTVPNLADVDVLEFHASVHFDRL